MDVPEVMPVTEFRRTLASVFERLGQPGAKPLFVGSHRKAEVVVMAVRDYEELSALEKRRQTMESAIASVRLEGLEPSVADIGIFDAVVDGTMSHDAAVAMLVARHRVRE